MIRGENIQIGWFSSLRSVFHDVPKNFVYLWVLGENIDGVDREAVSLLQSEQFRTLGGVCHNH
jgi:hypothetical protein